MFFDKISPTYHTCVRALCGSGRYTYTHLFLGDAELIVDRVEGWILYIYNDVDLVAAPSPHKVCMVVYEPEPVVCIATQPVRVTN